MYMVWYKADPFWNVWVWMLAGNYTRLVCLRWIFIMIQHSLSLIASPALPHSSFLLVTIQLVCSFFFYAFSTYLCASAEFWILFALHTVKVETCTHTHMHAHALTHTHTHIFTTTPTPTPTPIPIPTPIPTSTPTPTCIIASISNCSWYAHRQLVGSQIFMHLTPAIFSRESYPEKHYKYPHTNMHAATLPITQYISLGQHRHKNARKLKDIYAYSHVFTRAHLIEWHEEAQLLLKCCPFLPECEREIEK